MIDFKNLKSLIINGQSVKTLSIDGRVVWNSTPTSGWKGLKFKAEEAGSTVYMYKGGSNAPIMSLMYSIDDGDTWNDFTVCSSSTSLDGTIITLENVGDSVCFKAGVGGNTRTASSNTLANSNVFGMSGVISAYGNIMSILNGEDFENEKTVSDYMSRLFQNCTSLTKAPDLPATTLTKANCYQGMFLGCSSLTTAPHILPATTLKDYCYMSMFYNCQSLVKAPELPAVKLISYCYSQMFYGCKSLTQAPELPATELANDCYSSMFYGCKSLTQAPELPATSVGQFCYDGMFYNCTSLTQAPELPATELSQYSYRNMFRGCTSLNSIRIGYTGALVGMYFESWVKGVSNEGTFYYRGDDKSIGDSAIPNGWTVVGKYEGLSFKAVQDSTIKIAPYENAPVVQLMYSMDKGETWGDYVIGEVISVPNNEVITWKAKTPNTGLGSSSGYNHFVMTGSFEADGNINSLMNEDFESVSTLTPYCYSNLFNGCASLRNAPTLPTSLAQHCYDGMFIGCTSLTFINLSATELEDGCYVGMFNGCSSLNYIILGYEGDFTTTYFDNWVNGVADEGTLMYFGEDETRGVSAIPENWEVRGRGSFSGLKFTAEQSGSSVSLVKSGSNPPEVSLEYSLDYGDSWNTYTVGQVVSLPNVGDNVCFKATTTNTKFGNSSFVYNKWVVTGKVGASGNIMSLLDGENYEAKTTLPTGHEFNSMFRGCSGLTSTPDLLTTSLSTQCYRTMFYDCKDLVKTGLIFIDIDNNPSDACYLMFGNCSNLKEIKIGYTGNFSNVSTALRNWVSNVPSDGTFYYNGSDTTVGASAIPEGWTVETF